MTLIMILVARNHIEQHTAPLSSGYFTEFWRVFQTSKLPVIPNENDKRQKILLITHGRSGSTFTADILSSNSDVFYIFEPLYKTCIRHTGKDLLITDNGIKDRNVKPNMTSYKEEVYNVIKSFFNCNISHLPLPALQNPLLFLRPSTWNFTNCLKHSNNSVSTCIKDFESKCREKSKILIKTIRYPISILHNQMLTDPQLYVIYLIRDPRGTISSQIMNFKSFSFTRVGYAAQRICESMDNEIKVIRKLHALFPNRIKVVRYESLAFQPMKKTKEMFKFLKFNMTLKNLEFIQGRVGKKNSCNVGCSVRTNSKLAAYRWRKRIASASSFKIDKHCLNVYDKMCYISTKSVKDLRNDKFPLMKSCGFEGYRI
ncbi:hypothetical protein LOTGIDRAFT_156733 [Lottia gigantea]|uniref:Sulfotransferase domain-containing protein n=1 Tax=Lottia gigantea TaxID=225164 RepID=V4AYR0_LOTGI|nr:hypothetical protein LOTGIDRAFT_156733 [Lottia gigantea]ESP02788.1 hypothetical protein LOTGIDRAFT_156733 [Lottia gigantea]